MKMAEMYPSKYLGKEDCPSPIRAAISHVTREDLKNDSGNETKNVMYFQGNLKPLILNKGNAVTMCDGYGDDSEFWRGKMVEIFVDPSVMYGGKRVGGLRLRMPAGGNGAAARNGTQVPPGSWTLEQSIAECAKFGVSRDQLIAHLKSLGNAGYNPGRDTVAVQELIRTAPQSDQGFETGPSSAPSGEDIPF